MSLGEYAIAEETIASDLVEAWQGLRYWVYVGGSLAGEVEMNSFSIEEDETGAQRARCTILNSSILLVAGKTLEIIYEDSVLFGGVIRTLDLQADPSGAVEAVEVEAEGWDLILRRRYITKQYQNVTAGQILLDGIVVSGADADNIVPGFVDQGPNIILADAVNQRMSEFVRDVSSAGGGFGFVDANRRFQFRSTSLRYSSLVLTKDVAEVLAYSEDLDNYRNRQIVKVTGQNGSTTVTETRDDFLEQAERADSEGGSGIYTVYEEVKHPLSSVVGDLSIMGQTVGFLALRTYSRNTKRVRLRMRAPGVQVREIVQVNMPSLGLLGPFSVEAKTTSELAGELLFDVQLIEGGFSQSALESLLKIVGAARTTVSIDASLFPNVQTFSVAGTTSFVVPAGVFIAQLTGVGGSGGGGGGVVHHDPVGFGDRAANGGNGGNSGKAVTIIAVTPGESLDVIVGNFGAAGANDTKTYPAFPTGTNGSPGGNSQVKRGVAVLVQGDGSLGGGGSSIDNSPPSFLNQGANGPDAGGIGDAISVGGGKLGGNKGTGSPYVQPFPGLVGFVEIRW